MAWRWNNPSRSEAIEAYEYYKGKYNRAANQKAASEHKERGYISERNAATAKINALNPQKTNLEKRLRGVEEIIKMMEGKGGWFSANVPESIERAKNAVTKTDESFRRSIKLSGGISAACLETAFKTKTVSEDEHTASALSAFIAERNRLEEKLALINKQITDVSSQISSLKRKIDACNAEQASLRSSMNSYLYDMNHYKKHTYRTD